MFADANCSIDSDILLDRVSQRDPPNAVRNPVTATHANDRATFDVSPVGPFTGFGNFLRKELADWWKSWRLLVVFLIVTLIQLAQVFSEYANRVEFAKYYFENHVAVSKSLIATSVLVDLYKVPILFVFIIIFSTMGILTTEKATGTLAWNLTKPLGRTAVFVSKLLAATLMLWFSMCVLPVLLGSACLTGYYGVSPDFSKLAPIVGAALVWIGFWVLLILTISLGFQSQGAVGGIAIACWVVPFLFSALLGEILGKESRDWLLDRFGPNAPFWSYYLVADEKLMFRKGEIKTVWYYAFAVWTIVLSVFSLRVFNRQEIGA